MKTADMKLDVVRSEPTLGGFGSPAGTEYTLALNGCELDARVTVGEDRVHLDWGLQALFVDEGEAAKAAFAGAADIEDMRERLTALHAAGNTRVPVELRVERGADGQLQSIAVGPAGDTARLDQTASFNSAEWAIALALLRDEGLLDPEGTGEQAEQDAEADRCG